MMMCGRGREGSEREGCERGNLILYTYDVGAKGVEGVGERGNEGKGE